MTRRRLAWTLFGLCLTTSAVGVLLLALVPPTVLEEEGDSFALSVTFVLVSLVFGLVGAIVASRMPANPIGWLFLSLALIEGCYALAYGYTHYSLGVTELTATPYTAWFADWSSPVSPALIGLAFLLFPDGRLLSRRWRPVAWYCVSATVPVVAHYAFAPGPIAEFPSVRNPLGLERAGFLRDLPPDPFIASILGCACVAVVVRFRRSRGVERQQLKWFAWSAGLMTSLILVSSLVPEGDDEGTVSYVAGFVFAVLFCGLPVSAGIAILRYRLYDIDLVINRTLVYGALTAMLVATYLGSVLLFRLALDPLTGDSDLAVAASTLGVAALFRPLRAQIQAIVDRRFYRSRYDAARTLERFSGRLRDELDLDQLGSDLRVVVRDTVAPAHVTLWLRRQT